MLNRPAKRGRSFPFHCVREQIQLNLSISAVPGSKNIGQISSFWLMMIFSPCFKSQQLTKMPKLHPDVIDLNNGKKEVFSKHSNVELEWATIPTANRPELNNNGVANSLKTLIMNQLLLKELKLVLVYKMLEVNKMPSKHWITTQNAEKLHWPRQQREL